MCPPWQLLVTGSAVLITLAACGGQTAPTPTALPAPTLVASLTATIAATSEPVVETPAADVTPGAPTETPVVITVEPLLGQSVEPPLDITLPEGWLVGYDTLLLTDVDAMRPVPLAVWTGPVSGGTGTIVLLWGFPSLIGGNPLEAQIATPAPDLWADGLRLLRLAVVENGCNIGTDLRRDYRIGLLAAVGTQFSAVDCPTTDNTRGWFAGLNESGFNYVFYVYTDPIDAMTEADDELQIILETIRFRPIEQP
jgi:hypothetical protein